jgi:hypothetical protein
MDSDFRDQYKLITNIETLLDASTKLNNPPTQSSISTTLVLRLKMLSRQKYDPSIRKHTRTGDQRKENRLGKEHAWRRREMHTGFREEQMKEGGRLEDLIADGRLLLKQILTTMGEEYRIYLALDKDKWRDVVNAVMNQQAI